MKKGYNYVGQMSAGGIDQALTKDARGIARANFFATCETVIGKMLHIFGFFTCEDELRHPLSDDGRELKTVPTDREVLSQVGILMLQRPIGDFTPALPKNNGDVSPSPVQTGQRQSVPYRLVSGP